VSSLPALSRRVYKSRGLAVALLCSFFVTLHASPGARGQRAASLDAAPTLNVNYRDNGTITVTLSDGTSVGAARAPGTVIPPGTYNVVFNHDAKVLHQFHIIGPGADTTVSPADGSDGMCGGSAYLYGTYPVTLQPNSTYVFQDDYQPSVIHEFFSTSGAAPVGTAPAASGGGKPSPTPSPTGSRGTITGTGVLGGAALPLRGTLAGTVEADGALTLTLKGRGVSKLKEGRYKVALTDRTAASGFTVQALRKRPLVLSGIRFMGKRMVDLELNPGRWMFFSAKGPRHVFFVTS
jgi:hypothetical protein